MSAADGALQVNAATNVRQLFKQVRPGQVIEFDDGVYPIDIEPRWWVNMYGETLHNITLRAKNAGKAIIRIPASANNASGLHVRDANNVTLSGLVIDAVNAKTNGVLIENTASCTLVRVTVMNAAHNGIKAGADVGALVLENVTTKNTGFGVPEDQEDKQHAVYSQALSVVAEDLWMFDSAGGGFTARRKAGASEKPARVTLTRVRAVRCALAGVIALNTDAVLLDDVWVVQEIETAPPNGEILYGAFEGVRLNDVGLARLSSVVVHGCTRGIGVRPEARRVEINDAVFTNCDTGIHQHKRAGDGYTRVRQAVFANCRQDTDFKDAGDIDIQ